MKPQVGLSAEHGSLPEILFHPPYSSQLALSKINKQIFKKKIVEDISEQLNVRLYIKEKLWNY